MMHGVKDMDRKFKNEIRDILNELPDENSSLDYKEIPYEKCRHADFISDLCAFLNSNESYDKDKFIIFGVRDATKERIGLNEKQMEDDNIYQSLAEKIQPRPIIETGTIPFELENKKINFGYIIIPKENNDRPYTIIANYPNEKKVIRNSDGKEIKSYVFASTAYIRRGSTNNYLSEYDRREIYRMTEMNIKNIFETFYTYNEFNLLDRANKVLKGAIIFGGWDEKNAEDKMIISDYIGKPYEEWIHILRKLLKESNDIFEYKNSKWNVKNKELNLQRLATEYYRDDIDLFKDSCIKVLSERNPKFDLDSNVRYLSNLYNKIPKYSKLFRKSIAESLAIITSNNDKFDKCNTDVKNLSFLVVRTVLNTDNWEIWASLEYTLPLLSEAAPNEFLEQVDNKITNHPEMISKLLHEKEQSITTSYYSTWLYCAIEVVAWEPRYLTESCMILSKMAKYDGKAIEHITNILLPWLPHTKAPIDKRIIVVKNILKDNPHIGWKVLMSLMPGKTTFASPSHKPTWNNKIEEKNEGVSKKDYWFQIETYIDLAISNAKTNGSKLCDLIDILHNIPEDTFHKICIKLSSKPIVNMIDTRKYVIWNHLEDLIVLDKKISNSDKFLSPEELKEIDAISCALKPSIILVYAKRWFRKDTWNLMEDAEDYKTEENHLLQYQIDLCKKIVLLGNESIISFAKTVENPYVFGICIAKLDVTKKTEDSILDCLQEKKNNLVELGKGYVFEKFNLHEYDWINSLKIQKWGNDKKLNLLLVLPYSKSTFRLVETSLLDNDEYWKKVEIRVLDDDNELNYAIKKLLQVNRPEKGLSIISLGIHANKYCGYDKELAIACLKQSLKSKVNYGGLHSFNITEVIKDLQKSNISQQELLDIEWAYLPLLIGKEYRPISLEQKMADDPYFYNDILCLAYKSHSLEKNPDKIDDSTVKRALDLLHNWKIVPGLVNNRIDNKFLNNWYTNMKKISKNSDRLEVGLSNFGGVLYYAPKDENGFWIDKNVAEILNQEDAGVVRDGFYTETYNSLGTINLDSEGSEYVNKAKEYSEKTNEADEEGFVRLAHEMRKLSDRYTEEAENIKMHFNDYK